MDCTKGKIFEYQGAKCFGVENNYMENGNLAIEVFEEGTGEPMCLATICLDDVLPENEAYIKDYSENEGILEAFVKAGIVEEVIGMEPSGFVLLPLCRINRSLLGKWKEGN